MRREVRYLSHLGNSCYFLYIFMYTQPFVEWLISPLYRGRVNCTRNAARRSLSAITLLRYTLALPERFRRLRRNSPGCVFAAHPHVFPPLSLLYLFQSVYYLIFARFLAFILKFSCHRLRKTEKGNSVRSREDFETETEPATLVHIFNLTFSELF